MGAPFAFAAAGCALRPWTPSASVAYSPEALPSPVARPTPSSATVIGQWQLPTDDPWTPYQKLTLLSALDDAEVAAHLPDPETLDVVMRARASAARVVSVPDDVLFIVDMRGAASVTFGAELSRTLAQPVSLVTTFNNWPAEDEIIPAEETLAALARESPRQHALAGHSVPVFLLDAWRLAYRDESVDDDVTDNRYFLGQNDMPSASTLLAAGVRRVIYLVESLDEAETEEDDLNELFASYQDSGIGISMVDLSWVGEKAYLARWSSELAPVYLHVVRRRTLMMDPAFYIRSRGGFGGVHGVPGSWGGHGGG